MQRIHQRSRKDACAFDLGAELHYPKTPCTERGGRLNGGSSSSERTAEAGTHGNEGTEVDTWM